MSLARSRCALAALVALSGCGRGASEPTAVRTVDAAEIVTLGGLPGFADVRELLRDENGIWILDGQPPYLTYAPTDDPGALRRFGSEGSGPGELRSPRGLRPVEGGVAVYDATLRRRVAFTPEGALLDVRADGPEAAGWIRPDMAEATHVDPWRVRVAGAVELSLVFPDRVTSAAEVWTGSLVARPSAGGEARFRLDLAELARPTDRSPGVFAPVPLWDVCGASLVLWNPVDARLVRRDLAGAVESETPLPAATPEITPEGLEAFLRHQARLELGPGYESHGIDFPARAHQARDAFGPTGPAFVDLRCGAGAEVWLQTFDLGDDPLGHSSTWVRLAQGHPAQRVRFPSDFRPLSFEGDGVLGVERTAAGDHLARWRWRSG